jgi:hypothetical protein
MSPEIERTPDGHRFVVSRSVAAPAEVAWRVLTDTERWPEWGPSVAAVECADRFVTAGSRGYVRPPGPGSLLGRGSGSMGPRIPFRIVDCENHRWTWRVAGIPATGHRVEEEGETCRVAIEVPMLAVGYVPVCRRALGEIARIALCER